MTKKTHLRPANVQNSARNGQTICASAAVGAAHTNRSVAPPLFLSATYAWDDVDEKPAFDYARSGNPTRRQLEDTLAELEDGAGGVVAATGMAAVNLPTNFVKPGELIIAPHDCYGGTYRLLSHRAARGDFELAFIDQTDPEALAAAFARNPKLVYIETPSNPLLRITDVEDVVARAKAVGAITVADNTFLSPALQNPLTLGCDIVVHSTTKYINGHSDVVGGAAIAKDPALAEELAWWANCTGVTGSPFDSYLTLRGVRTLFARLERQQASAGAVAEKLAADPRVERVYYPGLASHPGHEIAARQQRGFGAMLSVDFAEGVDAKAFLRSLNLFTIAESLGGFESLVCCPALMTHAAMPPEARAEAGISDRLVRFSVGLEHEVDLLADIDAALEVSSSDAQIAAEPANASHFAERKLAAV
ncbi:MAG: cystathionine gamma-synthase [Pseudomonadota bacterium]